MMSGSPETTMTPFDDAREYGNQTTRTGPLGIAQVDPARPGTSDRLWRDACLVIYGLVAALYAWVVLHALPGQLGCDLTLYQRAAQSWVSGAPLYPARQLAGPYAVTFGDILYPPIAMPFFWLSLFLPALLWWLIPLGTVGVIVWRLHPSLWVLAGIGLLLLAPTSAGLILSGNPSIWLAAALAVALYWRPAAVLLFLKPSLFPLALVGVRSRGWWLITGLFALASLALLPLTFDWFRVIANERGAGLLYSLHDLPLLCVPLVAWLGRVAEAERLDEPAGRLWRLCVLDERQAHGLRDSRRAGTLGDKG